MNRILTRAIMKHNNDFFKMSTEEQDVFKLSEHSDIDKKIRRFVRKGLGMRKDTKDADKILEFNIIMLPYDGIGKDSFMLNEFDWNEKILTYANLYEYNEAYHAQQEEYTKEDNENFEPTELYNRFNSWARMFINEKFFYADLFSLNSWMFWQLEEFWFQWGQEQIPHKYVSGKDDGKKTKGGFKWEKNLDADGLEGWYEQISKFSSEYLYAQMKERSDIDDKVYIFETTEFDNDPSKEYIFGSMSVLKDITFKNFVDDCNNVIGNNDDILKLKDKKLKEFEEALVTKLEEIKKSPPNVREIKKNKIIMSADVMHDLEDL